MICGPKKVLLVHRYLANATYSDLTTESVEGAALTFESIDHVHGGHGLSLGVLGVGNSIPDDILEEYLQNTTGFFIDEARDTLDTTTASQTADGGLGDTTAVHSLR